MRKFYALLAGLFMCLAGSNISAQTSTPDVANFTFVVNAPNNDVVFTNTSVLSTVGIGTTPGFRRAYWSFGDGTIVMTPPLAGTQHHYQSAGTYTVCLKIYRYSPNLNDSTLSGQICKTVVIETICRANFESISTAANPLGKYFVAQPWHNQNKKPVRICWNFGDGRDTCIQYPANHTGAYGVYHAYSQPGNYNVCVNIQYEGSCQAQSCRTVEITAPDNCRANFERIQIATTNNPLNATFKALPWNNNNKKPVRICWEFGDGSDTCIQYSNTFPGPYTVNHTYTNVGLYEVCVKILYQGGCEARKCEAVRIEIPDICRADFERIPVLTTNNPLQSYFKALPGHNNNRKPSKICWTFGDGRDTCINYPENYTGLYGVSHTYSHPGQYEVCVKITYYGGCEARKCKPVVITQPDICRADFERIPTLSTNDPLRTYFKALPEHNNNKKPSKICWTFGDGRDTCITYPENYTGLYGVSHTYNQSGQYEVCVKIIYYGGCEARKCKPVVITQPDICRADFERIPTLSTNDPLRTYFKALPEHNNNKKPSKICWTFGDGRDTCINYPENYTGQYVVGHNYNQPGQYEVCVKITYYGGCEARKCRMVEIVHPDRCSADFERLPLTTANTPLTVGFKALPWHNNDKKPVRICWTFGDGRDTCINYTPNHTGPYVVAHRYNLPGQYEVCVKIIYAGGCEARKCRVISVSPPIVTCSVNLFEITPSITSLVRGFLAVPHTEPTRRPERICWYFGDGEDTCIMIDPTQPLPDLTIRHTYPGPGVYRACVKIRFEGGCIAEKCVEVVIRPASDLCGGYMTDSLIAPRTFKFKGFSIHNPNDEVLSYRWSFGDGSSALGREVTHIYSQGGEYRVCLTIKTRLGCETNICKTVRIPGNNQPALVITPNPVVNELHAQFFSTHTEQVNIKIMNGFGVQVRAYTRNATVGSNNWGFDLSTLMPGIYTFIVQSPNQLASAIFIKL